MKTHYQKGIALFIAVVATAALFLIALAISDISYKEQIISSSGSASKVAFYGADSGAECALYYDLKGPNGFLFATTSPNQTADFECNGQMTNPVTESIAGSATTTFYFNVSNSPKSCTVVTVAKWQVGSLIRTKVESRGYNNTCSGGPLPDESLRNLERSFRVTY